MATQSKPFIISRMPGFGSMAIFMFFMLYAPLFLLVVFSFNERESVAVWGGISSKWYEAAWADRHIKEAAFRSLWLAAVAATVSTSLATLAAIATTRTRAFRGMTAVYAIINMPLMVPEIVTAVALLIFFASIKVATGYTGAAYLVAAHSAFCVPFAYLPIRARLESMDATLETAAADLYASPIQAFRRITLPLLWPGIIAGFMLAFVTSLDDVVITDHIKSAGMETLPTYMLGQLRRSMTPEVNAVSAMFFALSVVLVTFFFFMNRKK
ncbi:MAG TPA: ABC transporter permease [Dongiaceae bacterium]|jgi:spermidine/putrescine transport system permease protein|nr:ABC transporter permease [Dongiaceae bacterium]